MNDPHAMRRAANLAAINRELDRHRDPDRDALARVIEGCPALLSTGSDLEDWYRARSIADAVLAHLRGTENGRDG